jgi:hypothetical protein
MGVLVATGTGFAATWMGTKGHHLSYCYFVIAIYLLERMNLFEKGAPYRKILASGLILGVGTFANNLVLPLFLYCLFRGLFVLGIKRLALLGLVSVLPLLTLKTGFSFVGIWSADRTDRVLFSHFLAHMRMIYQHLVHGQAEPIKLVHTTVVNPWTPFSWIKTYFKELSFICGAPILVLGICGIPRLTGKRVTICASVLAAVALSVVGVHTYWPYWMFQGYTSYYVAVTFFICAGSGILNISELFSESGLFRENDTRNTIYILMIVSLTTLLVISQNRYCFTGQLIDFYRFFFSHSFAYPVSWDFNIFNW